MTFQQILISVSCALAFTAYTVQAQTTQISTEYLMTLYAPLEAPQQIDNTLFIYTIPPVLKDGSRVPRLRAASSLLEETGFRSCPQAMLESTRGKPSRRMTKPLSTSVPMESSATPKRAGIV